MLETLVNESQCVPGSQGDVCIVPIRAVFFGTKTKENGGTVSHTRRVFTFIRQEIVIWPCVRIFHTK